MAKTEVLDQPFEEWYEAHPLVRCFGAEIAHEQVKYKGLAKLLGLNRDIAHLAYLEGIRQCKEAQV
jgi:hypothetical protein